MEPLVEEMRQTQREKLFHFFSITCQKQEWKYLQVKGRLFGKGSISGGDKKAMGGSMWWCHYDCLYYYS